MQRPPLAAATRHAQRSRRAQLVSAHPGAGSCAAAAAQHRGLVRAPCRARRREQFLAAGTAELQDDALLHSGAGAFAPRRSGAHRERARARAKRQIVDRPGLARMGGERKPGPDRRLSAVHRRRAEIRRRKSAGDHRQLAGAAPPLRAGVDAQQRGQLHAAQALHRRLAADFDGELAEFAADGELPRFDPGRGRRVRSRCRRARQPDRAGQETPGRVGNPWRQDAAGLRRRRDGRMPVDQGA